MDFAKQVGNKLKKLRLCYGLTQGHIADILEIDRSAYAYYESGRSTPPLSRLVTLAKMYSVSVDWLLGCKNEVTLDEKADIIALLAKNKKTLPMYHRLLSITDYNRGRRLSADKVR